MNSFLYHLLFLSSIYASNAIRCGHPGRPAYGLPSQTLESYSEGQSVSYACNSGYYMVGTTIRRCLPNGTWTGNIPVCDTTLSPVGYTSSSEALSLYPPELAVDGNKRSCFYSNRRKPRWWRMDMGFPQTVLSVSITVPFASSEHHFTIYVIEVNGTLTKYHKCASFRGIFSSQAMILSCGNIKGIVGSVLHIEDNSPHLDHFGLCEVEVFVKKDYYECGDPETPTNGFLTDKPSHTVEYNCHNGYKLEGPLTRTCLRNGQWTGGQPICREIKCPQPLSIENGYYKLIAQNTNKPVLGTKIVYGCKTGYSLNGVNDTQYCQENSTWTGATPECHLIDCGLPSENIDYLGGRFKLLNSSTKFQSIAELVCFSGKKSGVVIRCEDTGMWSDIDFTCIYNKLSYYTANTSVINGQNKSDMSLAAILGSVIILVSLLLLLLVFILFKKKIISFKWSTPAISCGRRPSWALEALRSTNLQLRKPFRFQTNCAVKTISTISPINSSIKSVSSKKENDYEEIQNFSSNPISDETEDKIRRAALIAAELAVINERKQQSDPSSQPPTTLYAKVDLIQKHRDRLLRQQKRLQELTASEDLPNSRGSTGANSDGKINHTNSNPELQVFRTSTNYETIRFSSVDLSESHLLKDNLIFVGHPGVVGNCDNLSQFNANKSNVKHIYTISP